MDFDRGGTSALVVGDNGDGKSTLLRSIGMGLCDESSAAALLRDLPGDFVRHGQKKATIKIWITRNNHATYLIETTITSLRAFERVTQRVFRLTKDKKRLVMSQDRFPWHQIFVSAYGAGARTIGTGDFNSYVAADAVYSLFMYKEPLQNPELIIRRLIEAARESGNKGAQAKQRAAEKRLEEITALLSRVLKLGRGDRVDLTKTGIRLKRMGQWAELGAAGDGYTATTTWILDLISWWFLYRRGFSLIRPLGIVLIDEVEQHLHPKWQIEIVGLLQDIFPRLQIIASTHSPLVVSGANDLYIHRVDRGQHRILNASGWLAEDVYRQVMGLPSSRPKPEREVIQEYRRLYLRTLEGKASRKEKARLRRLKKNFTNLPETDPVLLTSKLESMEEYLDNGRRSLKQ
jgi:energy-coupling factor transporter ATP-binding protein EcfA2